MAVLVESAQEVVPLDPLKLRRLALCDGHSQVDAAMGSGGVVVLHVDGEHLFEVPVSAAAVAVVSCRKAPSTLHSGAAMVRAMSSPGAAVARFTDLEREMLKLRARGLSIGTSATALHLRDDGQGPRRQHHP